VKSVSGKKLCKIIDKKGWILRIDRVVESYRQQNKPLPIGLAKGEFTVPDDFNDSLPDEILDLFNNSQ
jgi:hypothetical protein